MDKKLEADVRLLTVVAAQLDQHCVDADVKSIRRAEMDVADLCNSDENIDSDEPNDNSRQRIESIAFIDGWDDDLNVPSDLELDNGSTNEEGSRKRTL
jgi:hypothetical protein